MNTYRRFVMDKLSKEKAADKLKQLNESWKLIDNSTKLQLTKEYASFADAVRFLGKVARCAEQEAHHPDLCVFDYNRLKITLTTHDVGGLTDKDFLTAARFEEHLGVTIVGK